MMRDILVNVVCPFLGTASYVVLFNVPEVLFKLRPCGYCVLGCVSSGIRRGIACSSLVSGRAGGSVFVEDADCAHEMPYYHLSAGSHTSHCAGSRDLLYSILSCDEPAFPCSREGNRRREDGLWDCCGNCGRGVYTQGGFPGTLLEGKEKTEKVEGQE